MFDPVRLPLPEPLEKQRTDRSLELQHYFVRTAVVDPICCREESAVIEAFSRVPIDPKTGKPAIAAILFA